MLGKKIWLYQEIPNSQAEEIARKAGISLLLAKIFLSRGISDSAYIQKFINPQLEELHDPFLMKDMKRAVERIASAIRDKEKILIYGDYDVDGTTSTSILWDFLSRQGAVVDFYIPSRHEEGYGLSINAIDKIIGTGVSLIVTVDCGITAVDEVKYVIENGMDIIVTDHHQCKEQLPEALAVVNPCRPDCPYPFKQLAGVGVVYKLLAALCKHLGLGDIYNEYLDIVSLGTVADVVPLVDENRLIVSYGVRKLAATENIGLKALIHCAGLEGKPITSYGVGFGLGPRINAAGRVGDASRAVQLFTTRDEQQADQIAHELNEENIFRQNTESGILQQAIEMIETKIDLEKEKVIVVAGEGWHHGVIGIVASRITERYYRPCILLSQKDGVCKGSGRSIEGFNLFDALNYCKDVLKKFGGHELAAGLELEVERLDDFREKINAYAGEILSQEDLIPKIKVDVSLDKMDITIKSIKELEQLAPFGAGNPGPVFVYNGLRVGDIKTLKENKHVKLKLADGSFCTDAIGFSMGSVADEFVCDDIMDVVCTLEINNWNAMERIQLNLKDVKRNQRKDMEKQFYSSLHHCVLRDLRAKNPYSLKEITEAAKVIETKEEFLDCIKTAAQSNKTVGVFINDLQSMSELEKIRLDVAEHIGNSITVSYMNASGDNKKKLQMVVNPALQFTNDLNSFGVVLLYGKWVDLHYLRDLVNAIDKYKLFLYNIGVYDFSSNDIIPDRSDLGAVYQYVRKVGGSPVRVDNMHTTANEIEASYKIVMNYFKFRQCIEIFEELGLLKREYYGLYGVSMVLADNTRTKTNLDNSALFRRLQALKG